MAEPDWPTLEAGDPGFDWDKLRVCYSLAGVVGLPWSAMRSLIAKRISAERAASMTSEDLLSIPGVGPATVRALRAAKP